MDNILSLQRFIMASEEIYINIMYTLLIFR